MRVEIRYIETEYRVVFYSLLGVARTMQYPTLGEAMKDVQDWLRDDSY